METGWVAEAATLSLAEHRPVRIAAYAQLKTQLARDHPDDREAYTAGKRQFIHEVLSRHGVDTGLYGLQTQWPEPIQQVRSVEEPVIQRRE